MAKISVTTFSDDMMTVTTLSDEGVTTRSIDDLPADIMQELWTALKTGNYTVTFHD